MSSISLRLPNLLSRMNDSGTVLKALHISSRYMRLGYSCPLKQVVVSRLLLDASSYQILGIYACTYFFSASYTWIKLWLPYLITPIVKAVKPSI